MTERFQPSREGGDTLRELIDGPAEEPRRSTAPGGEGGDGAAFLYLGIHRGGRAVLDRDGTRVPLAPGDLVVSDTPRPAFVRRGGDCRMVFFRVPSPHLGVPAADLRRVTGLPVRGSSGMGALVSAFLSALAAEPGLRRTPSGGLLARNAVDLVALLLRELLDARAAAGPVPGAELLARVHAFIEENLTDPGLSPESIALAHHISVRYLHKLFRGDGTTVGRWVRRRRLDACRLELGRPSHRRPTVAAVAHRWGFASPSHFSRVFRDAYGMSPSAWQILASAGHGTPAADPGVAHR